MDVVSAVTIDNPLVSVIIPLYNAYDVIGACLDSVLRQDYANIEIIAVDDCSKDSTAALISKNYPGVKLLQCGKNSGFAATVNLGIRKSAGDIIALLNMDTVVKSNWLSSMVRFIAGDESIGLAGSKILFPDGYTVQHAGGLLRENGVSIHIGRGEQDNGQFESVRDVDYLCGASLGFKRSLLDKIGLFDENYRPLYYEDADLAFRVKAAGKRVAYFPGSVLTHKESVCAGGLTADFYYYYHKSRLRFVFKNYPCGRFFSFFKEEKRWFINELPGEIREVLLKAYLSAFFFVPYLLFKRIAWGVLHRAFASHFFLHKQGKNPK